MSTPNPPPVGPARQPRKLDEDEVGLISVITVFVAVLAMAAIVTFLVGCFRSYFYKPFARLEARNEAGRQRRSASRRKGSRKSSRKSSHKSSRKRSRRRHKGRRRKQEV
ncbi:uncharacterized protein AMSG_06431 [Thecamonas trahens ATCC 50062]|uniref:Uncharacterized protein n=1 Tax=Thecamonas trahens ATCC 50062 TaxID=461836 RepID=A0A0L0DD51_THETB|nr:hypothetical protein AMSG_06431 [Thecamonas trahens ATCC 50062]KNC50272.1 hypothetical protein AMSG_06431 [Thecamonas trahens ATCC 50062]|eukprot:XP_013757099.1 hypothetical protein AMSG_06431 [Thecamonas trahens ATCC 50062]